MGSNPTCRNLTQRERHVADTLPYVRVTPGAWTNLNTASGIAAGTAAEVQNTSTKVSVDLVIKSTTPDNSEGPFILSPVGKDGNILQIAAGESAVWAWADSPVSVGMRAVG